MLLTSFRYFLNFRKPNHGQKSQQRKIRRQRNPPPLPQSPPTLQTHGRSLQTRCRRDNKKQKIQSQNGQIQMVPK